MMRSLSSFASVLVPRSWGGQIVEVRQCVDAEACNRLTLLNIRDGLHWRLSYRNCYFHDEVTGEKRKYVPPGHAEDFHSLLWEQCDGASWRTRVRRTARHFRKRAGAWVIDIHSFDPVTGVAIIKIGEQETIAPKDRPPEELEADRKTFAKLGIEGASFDGTLVIAHYSWVSWDLRRNEKLAVLKRCESPFDQYDG